MANIELLNKFNELPEEKRKEIMETVNKYRDCSLLDFVNILSKSDNEKEKRIALVGFAIKMKGVSAL